MDFILQCPFCGEKAELREHWGDCSKRPDWYEVECLNLNCGKCQDTPHEAVAAWNARPIENTLRARNAELEAEVARLEAERRRDALDGQAALDESNNEVARLRKALDALYQHSRRSRFKADAYMWEDAKAALEASDET